MHHEGRGKSFRRQGRKAATHSENALSPNDTSFRHPVNLVFTSFALSSRGAMFSRLIVIASDALLGALSATEERRSRNTEEPA